MNLLNKILILLIILFLINHLTSGKIFDTVKKYFNSCVEKFSNTNSTCNMIDPHIIPVPYAGQLDFPYLNGNENVNEVDSETYNLYKFINGRITPNNYNYEMTADRSEPFDVPDDMYKYIVKSLTTIFNQSNFKFKNIKIIDKLSYFNNIKGKDIIPFNFTADVYYNNKPIGNVVIYIESFIYEQIKGGLFSITNVRLQNRTNPNQKKKKMEKTLYRVNNPDGLDENMNKVMIDYNKINNSMSKNVEDIFINNDVVIPDLTDINLTEIDYELPSENMTSEHQSY
jgi:hypothetical protein